MMLRTLLAVLFWRMALPSAHAFVALPSLSFSGRIIPVLVHHRHGQRRQQVATRMVRNIDLPEALVFYGIDVLLVAEEGTTTTNKATEESSSRSSFSFRKGIEPLLQEVRDIQAAAIVIIENNENDTNNNKYNNDDAADDDAAALAFLMQSKLVSLVHCATQEPPNPRDVWEAIHAIEIQPLGFGGSAGFGRKLADPVRCPLPQHTVVFASTKDQCQAAVAAGMRVMCLITDNAVADAVVDSWEDVFLDDVATPGSFWLNPPHARDSTGHAVDPQQVMERYEQRNRKATEGLPQASQANNTIIIDDMAEDELARILADMDLLS